MSLKKDILWRAAIVYLGILIFGFGIIGKIIYLQTVEKAKWLEKSRNSTLKYFTIPANRGNILAEDGRLLATSIPLYEIRMDLNTGSLSDNLFYSKVDSLALCLSNLFKDKTREKYKQELVAARKKLKRYHLIKKEVNYIQLKELKSFPLFRRGRYKGGLIYLQENRRIRPHNKLAARFIGYITKSNRGNIVGIEGAYDQQLSGIEGNKLKQKISDNVWIPVSNKNEIEPKDGMDVVTTINIDYQDVAEKALLKQLNKQDAHHGTVVLMEVRTGEIKAIVNLGKDKNSVYRELLNYAVGESSEPGSTFKLPALMAALEDGYINLDDTIDTGNGIFKYYDKTIRDDSYFQGGHGKITLQRVFELSSNVGVSKVITEAYKDRPHHFVDRLYSMNLNDKLGVEIKGEGQPLIKYPGDKLWSGISLAMMSHGYEVRLTPLQTLTFYNAVANNGKMVKPKLVNELQYHGKTIKTYETEILNPSICSRSTLKKAKKMLEGVVENGTARNLNNPYFKIAGKTGTNQIYNKKYGYKSDSIVSYQASFVGYFPADNPEYSCIVVVNSPSKNVYYGHQVAGPVFLEIAKRIYASNIKREPAKSSNKIITDLPYSKNGNKKELKMVFSSLNIDVRDKNKDNQWVTTTKKEDHIELNKRRIVPNLVPNVIAMGAKDAVYLLENAGLKVVLKGRGSVKSQSIPPGTLIRKGQEIILEMSFI
ncbi:MAG: transpeptidase family protein [Bacteroidales bacterium]|nr:MAG: transpeptidase family protein [Bacteroidales bacterium]